MAKPVIVFCVYIMPAAVKLQKPLPVSSWRPVTRSARQALRPVGESTKMPSGL